MKLLIHDLNEEELACLELKPGDNLRILSDNGTLRPCIGCFGCWIKTPGVCVLKDDFKDMGQWLSECDEVIIISRCAYGSYSPFVVNVINRSIPYLLPYFEERNGEIHHMSRYENHFKLSVCFYGEDTDESERITAKALVKANEVNFQCKESQVSFHSGLNTIREVLQ